MNNLLENVFTIIDFTKPTISGVANIVKWLIGISSGVAVGIILFTLILKLITFPFDFYSRYSMRKNSVKMEEMRPELEKLQKQYADDKVLYNQKMMSLYKKNGYSMWGACLPTILTLVIFIVAINGYSKYSQYQNKEDFYNMSLQYNSAIYDGVEIDNDYILKNEETGAIYLNQEKFSTLIENGTVENNDITITATEYYNGDTFMGYTIKTSKQEVNSKVSIHVGYSNSDKKITSYQFFAENDDNYNSIINEARSRSAQEYKNNVVPFLWVKNIWMTDSPLEHPVYSNWESESSGCASCYGVGSGFKDKQGYDDENMTADLYNELTYNLATEKEQANGYFILCIITALVSLVVQIVMSKSQKAQMELQTVDGQGARQQQMMMWMMPIMMAFFSFMYTAAFSIYLILSSVISILTTFFINWFVDKKLGKTKNNDKKEVIRGRVYNAPVQEKKKVDKKPTDKKPLGDFIPQNENTKNLKDRLK